ncbi:MAG: hypothetical protein G3H99_02060 [Ferrovum sp.]|jgi:hypothetical protein|nr:hypothetical protein [Ferrovum sp.]
MILTATQYNNRCRSEPVREAVVVRLENAGYCALAPWKVMAARFDKCHLIHDIVSQIGLTAISNGSVIIQNPIDRCLI